MDTPFLIKEIHSLLHWIDSSLLVFKSYGGIISSKMFCVKEIFDKT